jgi:hypothetical protein
MAEEHGDHGRMNTARGSTSILVKLPLRVRSEQFQPQRWQSGGSGERNFLEVQKYLGLHHSEIAILIGVSLLIQSGDGRIIIVLGLMDLMVNHCRGKAEEGIGHGKQIQQILLFGIVFNMQRAILVGDGQVALFKNLEYLLRYIEAWIVEEKPHSAFLEDASKHELYAEEGPQFKRFFSRKIYYEPDLRYTAARQISQPGEKAEELRGLLIEHLSRCKKLSEDEKNIGISLKSAIQIFEERLGYTR